MKCFYTLLIICLSLSEISQAQNDFKHIKDSLWQVIHTSNGEAKLDAFFSMQSIYIFYYEEDIDSLVKFYSEYEKEAHKQNNDRYEANAKQNLCIKLFENSKFNEVMARAPEDLKFLYAHQKWGAYCSVYKNYALSCLYAGEAEKAMQVAEEFYRHCKLIDYPDAIPHALRIMGLININSGRKDEALDLFMQALAEAKKNTEITNLRLDLYFYIVQQILKPDRLDEAETILKEWETDLDKVAEKEGARNPSSDANLYRMYTTLYKMKNDFDMLEHYCNLLEQLGYTSLSIKLSILLNRSDIATARANHEQALEYANEGLALAETTNISNNVKVFLISKMSSLINLKRTEEIGQIFQHIMSLTDSIANTETQKRLDELRTVYEVDKITAEKERNRSYMLFAFGLCVLLAILLGIWIYYNRKIAKKNKALASQIKELLVQQELRDKEILNKTSFIPFDEEREDIICPESRKDQLCIAIRDIILKEKAYLNPVLTRDYLVERLGTNKDLFTEAFQYCFKISFPEYINSLRLKDAVILLEKSDLSIETIAEETGFGSVRTFQRQFKTKYNISPKEYRNSLKK